MSDCPNCGEVGWWLRRGDHLVLGHAVVARDATCVAVRPLPPEETRD